MTLEDANRLKRIKRVNQPRKLPKILSVEQVTQMIDAAGSLKYKAALFISYGAGLRREEVVNFRISDIDSERMIIRVEQGKGAQDRHAMLSPSLLKILREWYHFGRSQNRWLPGGWLFPGQNPINPLSGRQLNRAFHVALSETDIDKKVTLHSLCVTGGFSSHSSLRNVIEQETIKHASDQRQLSELKCITLSNCLLYTSPSPRDS